MPRHTLALPPEFAYPLDDWRITQRLLLPARIGEDETIFATANGYLGIRGTFEEGTPVQQPGTFIEPSCVVPSLSLHDLQRERFIAVASPILLLLPESAALQGFASHRGCPAFIGDTYSNSARPPCSEGIGTGSA